MRPCAAALLGLAALSCGNEPSKPPNKPTAEQTMPDVQTDLAALRKYLRLPPGDFSCRWLLQAREATRGPNANDSTLSAYVELPRDAWQAIAVELAGDPSTQPIPAPNDGEILLTDALAGALLPAERARTGTRVDDRFLSFQGTPLAKQPLAEGPMHVSRAVRLGDGLLVLLGSK
jgi:hypothetical protein